jgi:hypothetical protein
MTTCLRNVLLIGMALALVGCAAGSRGRGKPEGLAFFGPDANKLEKGGEGDWMLSYRNPDADFPSYDSIIIDPVSIWMDRDGNLSKVSAQDRQRLANNFYTLAHRSISRYLKVVAEPGERTLRLKIALTNAGASSRTLDTVSSVVPQLRATTTLVGYATGKPAFTGQAAFAFRLTDAQTGESVAMGAGKRVGNRTMGGLTDSWSDVNNALAYWADLAAYRICVEMRRGSCQKPSVKREF